MVVEQSVQAMFGGQAATQPFQASLGRAESLEELIFGGGEQAGEEGQCWRVLHQGAEQVEIKQGQAARAGSQVPPATGLVGQVGKERVAGSWE